MSDDLYQSLRGNDKDNDDDDDVDAFQRRHQQQDGGSDWKANVATFGKKMGEQMTVVGGKITESVSAVGEKMKDLFYASTVADFLVEEATADVLLSPDKLKNARICDLVNVGRLPSGDVARALKRRLVMQRGNVHVQLLALALLQTALSSCERLWADVSSEKVLEAMVRVAEDPTTPVVLRDRILRLIEAWGEAKEELQYFPEFEETYKMLKARGVVFPPPEPDSPPLFTPPPRTLGRSPNPHHHHHHHHHGQHQHQPAPHPNFVAAAGLPPNYPGPIRQVLAAPGVTAVDLPQGPVVVLDSKEILSVARNSVDLLSDVLSSAPPEDVVKDELATSLAAQCRQSKRSILNLIENVDSHPDSETILFEALSLNDDIDRVLSKLSNLRKEVLGEGLVPSVAAEEGGEVAAGVADAAGGVASGAAAAAGVGGGAGATTATGNGAAPTAILSMAGEAEDDGETEGGLVRRRTDGGGAAAGATSEAREEDDDEKALAALDAMVFGTGGSSVSSAASAAGATAQGQELKKDDKVKGDDLILF